MAYELYEQNSPILIKDIKKFHELYKHIDTVFIKKFVKILPKTFLDTHQNKTDYFIQNCIKGTIKEVYYYYLDREVECRDERTNTMTVFKQTQSIKNKFNDIINNEDAMYKIDDNYLKKYNTLYPNYFCHNGCDNMVIYKSKTKTHVETDCFCESCKDVAVDDFEKKGYNVIVSKYDGVIPFKCDKECHNMAEYNVVTEDYTYCCSNCCRDDMDNYDYLLTYCLEPRKPTLWLEEEVCSGLCTRFIKVIYDCNGDRVELPYIETCCNTADVINSTDAYTIIDAMTTTMTMERPYNMEDLMKEWYYTRDNKNENVV